MARADESTCVPIFRLASSLDSLTSTSDEFSAITTILLSRYLAERAIFSFLSGVTDIPFHTQSIDPDFNSISFESQSIALKSTFIFSFFPTAFAISISKPTSLPFASRKPIGAKVSSSPTTKVSLDSFFVSSLPPHAVKAHVIIKVNITTEIINLLLLFPFVSPINILFLAILFLFLALLIYRAKVLMC